MRRALLVALLALWGCAESPPDDLVKSEFRDWCQYQSRCHVVADFKKVKRIKDGDGRVTTRINFVHVKQGAKPAVVEAWCIFGRPGNVWKRQQCWSLELNIYKP